MKAANMFTSDILRELKKTVMEENKAVSRSHQYRKETQTSEWDLINRIDTKILLDTPNPKVNRSKDTTLKGAETGIRILEIKTST